MDLSQLQEIVSLEDGPGVCIDSRQLQPGDVFVAIRGTQSNGHDFLAEAVSAGAKYVLTERPFECQTADVIRVDDTSETAAVLAQAQHGDPAKKLTSLAVTGTNGKTTVAYLVKSAIEAAGHKCGIIGTVAYSTGAESFDAPLTTPDAIQIAAMQKKMVDAGCNYMVIEASSHSLSQNRLAAINFAAAAFTNLSGEHLDYHKTEDQYLAAKMTLFENLSKQATAVLNSQSPHSEKIAEKTPAKILWYAVDAKADIEAKVESADINGTCFTITHLGQTEKVNTPLLGTHNVSNHLAAAGLCLSAGLDLETIAKGLSALKCVPGRLERVEANVPFTVLIDYAHTDDALSKVLSALRPLCKGRLGVVFGCGGDRDRSKRPRMGAVVEELADCMVITNDNPRTEEPEFIIGEIVTGLSDPGADTVFAEPGRKLAIELAIEKAQKDDIILIAGKGHETYQIIGKEKIPFCDKTVALECIRKLK